MRQSLQRLAVARGRRGLLRAVSLVEELVGCLPGDTPEEVRGVFAEEEEDLDYAFAEVESG